MAGFLSDAQINRDMKYINDVNKIGYQNASSKQKENMYRLRKKYGDTIYKAGKFNPSQLDNKTQTLYTRYNPDSAFTRERQSGFFNTVDGKLKNNEAVSDKQLKYYKQYGDKWNLTPHDKRAMSYDEAVNQAKDQLDPLYQQAIGSLKKEKYQNELNAGQIATNRGLGRSGLAADQMTKIALATQGQMNQLNADQASRIADLAQSLKENDQARLDRQNQFEYQKSRDAVMDKRYNEQFAYQKSRDAVGDKRYESDSEWREYVYNNMSASEKAQLEWAKARYGEDAAWRMYELEYGGELQKEMSQAQIDYYNGLGLGDFLP